MSSYDEWKTRPPWDEANRGTKLRRVDYVVVWRGCPSHGWTEHLQWQGGRVECRECAKETARKAVREALEDK